MKRRPLLALLPLLATALVAPGVPATAAGESRSAVSSSPVRLWMPSEIEAYATPRGARANLGVQLIAQNAPFELWSTRADYDSPIVTEWRTATSRVRLPAGTMKDFSGLRKFLTLTVSRTDGKQVFARTRKACLASWMPQRLAPTAVPLSPYPSYCAGHPFALGSVQGIPQDYAVPLEVNGSMPLEPGRYRVTASIKPEIAAALGAASADATATSTLRVPRREDRGHAGPKPPMPMPAGAHHGRAAAPDLRPATRPTSARAGAPVGPVPDLRSLPSFAIDLNPKRTQLRFAATVWNAGSSALVLDGFRNSGDQSVMDTYQYFFDAQGKQTGYQQVGSMKYHDANHDHWHYEDFAEYSLVDADKKTVGVSKKISFCLANTDPVDLTVPGADWMQGPDDLGSMCGDDSALSVRQQLSAGHGDTYMQYRAGQAISVKDLPNGTYYLKVHANPFGRLVESDATNNVSYRRIRLVGKAGERRVEVPSVGRIVEPSMDEERPTPLR